MTESNGSNERLVALETNQQRITADVDALTKSVNTLAGAVRGDINKIMDRMNSSTKTQWPVVLAAATVLLVIVGMAGNGYVRDQGRHAVLLEKLESRLGGHTHKIGHPGLSQKVEVLESGFSGNQELHERRLNGLELWQLGISKELSGVKERVIYLEHGVRTLGKTAEK